MRAGMAVVKEHKFQAALLDLGRQVAEIKEAERLKMAEHLHDEFGQSLLVAKMRLGMLTSELPAQYVGSVDGVTEIISDLIRRTRASIEDLYSSSHCPAGLTAGLVSLAKETQTKHGVVCSTNLDSMPEQWRDEAKRVLYRAVRELLCNVTKHANTLLTSSEAKNRAILNALPDLMFLQTVDGVYLDYHCKEPRDLWLPGEQFLGKNMNEVLPADLAKLFLHCFKRAAESGEPVVHEYSLPINEQTRHFEARMIRSGNEQILTMVRDITERKQAGQLLREKESVLKTIMKVERMTRTGYGLL